MSWATPDPAARAVGMPPITGPVVRIETDGGVEFDVFRDVIGDDIVFGGVAYSRYEYRLDEDGLTRLSEQEADRLWEADLAAARRGVGGDGRWEIGWEPARASFFARHQTNRGDITRWFGSGHGTYPAVGALEQQLGFVLPATARSWLNGQARTAPGNRPGAASHVEAEDRRPDVAGRPGPAHRMRVPGRPDVAYEVALDDEPVVYALRVGPTRLEVLEVHERAPTGDEGPRWTVTYRLRDGDEVIFSGDDITVPGVAEPAGEAILRRVGWTLTVDPTRRLTSRQHDWRAEHGEQFAVALQPAEPVEATGHRTVTDPVRTWIDRVASEYGRALPPDPCPAWPPAPNDGAADDCELDL